MSQRIFTINVFLRIKFLLNLVMLILENVVKVVYSIVFVSNYFFQFKIDSETYIYLAAVSKDGDVSK